MRNAKKALYFFVASYFRFFAHVRLNQWKPKVVVITGSSGKTTLLHLIESQLGKEARYSHHANSAFGIPFDILGLKRKTLRKSEWLGLFLSAPFKTFAKSPKENIYIVEADCDRPHEGEFVASLLKPAITLWTNSGRTHTANFDSLVGSGKYKQVEDAIAHEFGFFIENATGNVIVNNDSSFIRAQLPRTKAQVTEVSKNDLTSYRVHASSTEFTYDNRKIIFPFLVPEETFYALVMTQELMEILRETLDPSYKNFQLPPGRSSVFDGVKDMTIIDSSYNATPDGVTTILQMFSHYPKTHKWVVLGDMLELGDEERQEHENLAKQLMKMDLERIILVGPRTQKYTYPLLQHSSSASVDSFEYPKDALEFIQAKLQGKEAILFKGARFLEGIIEHLLKSKSDIAKLCRREEVWQKRRQQWGL